MLVAALCISLLAGCAHIVTVTEFPDGRKVTTKAFSFGSTSAITGLSDEITKDGRTISLDSANNDVNVEALKQNNLFIKMLVQGLAAGAVEGAR